MKTTYTNKLKILLLAISLSFLALPAFASKDDIQTRASEHIYRLQQQIKAAEVSKKNPDATKAAECKTLVEQGKTC